MRRKSRWYIRGPARWVLPGTLALSIAACGDDPQGPSDATDVPYGQTTFVALVNPVVNTINNQPVPAPDTARSGVRAAVAQGPSAQTDSVGVAVLSPVPAGTRLLSFSRGALSGQVSVSIADKDLREVAAALTSSGAALMANVQYAFGGQVVEVTPDMTISEVNAKLAESDLIVFFRSGTYAGDLTITGSNVTLYGEGRRGGQVVIDGSLAVLGNGNRIRGARITGGLSVPGDGFGMSFSRVEGTVAVSGDLANLLQNAFCGLASVTSSSITALGNAGLDPVPAPADC